MPVGWTNKPLDCNICHEALLLPRKNNRKHHDDCRTVYSHEYNKGRWSNMSDEEKEQNNLRGRKLSKQRRITVLSHYGGCCTCCGENRYEFLGIDHINGNGKIHRQEVGGGSKIYKWLVAHDFPEGFRVLCHNCNMSYGFYGYCPHQISVTPMQTKTRPGIWPLGGT